MNHIIQLTSKLLSCILLLTYTFHPLMAKDQCDLINNGNFSNGHQNWIAAVKDKPGIEGMATFADEHAYFQIAGIGEEKSFISLEQRGVHLQIGESYQIRFRASAPIERSITVSVSDIGNNYLTLAKSEKDFDLTNEMQVYEYTFNANITDNTARLIFMLGSQIGDVYIDDVSMIKLNCENCLPAGTPCDDKDACTINDEEDGFCNCVGKLSSNNQILNSDFSGNFYDAWKRTIKTEEGVVANLINNDGEAHFEIEKTGTANWHISLEQRTLSIEANQPYRINFRAKASEERNINIKISDVDDNLFHITHFNQDVELTNSFQSYSFPFVSPVTDDLVRIIFNMGLETPDVTIDDVTFEQYNCEYCADYNKACDDGNPCTINDYYDASCNCVSNTQKEEYLNNGNFSNQFGGWRETVFQDSGAVATTYYEDELAHFIIEKDGTKNWHISLEQRDISFTAEETYAINFKAKAAIARNINFKLSAYPIASTTYFNQSVALTENWQAYHYLYTPETADNFARIIFNMGIDDLNTGRNEIFIDDVSITNTACSIYTPVHPQDSLALVQFYQQSCQTDCELDWYLSRPVHTWEGVEIENERVVALHVAEKGLSGNMDTLDLLELRELDLSNNNFNGTLADFSSLNNLTYLNVSKNQLNFEAVGAYFDANSSIEFFEYSPQYMGIETSHIVEAGSNYTLNSPDDLTALFTNATLEWKQNDVIMQDAHLDSLFIEAIDQTNIGIYTLHLTKKNIIPGLELIATHYVFINGYDIKGQQIYNNEIMVLFDNEEEREIFANKYLNSPYNGRVSFQCDCNRLLYLFQFTSGNEAAKVLLDIDRSRQTSEIEVEIEGDPNELIEIENLNTAEQFWKWPQLSNQNLTDEVSIYILDSGLNKDNLINTNFLMEEAPLICNDQNKAEGYSFVTNQSKISNQYVDSIGHGTYGFNAIANGKENNLKIVPIKIFDQNGKGSLFHFVCGLFHSIDNKADIINISAGFKKVNSSIVESALQLAQQKGIFITTAAGNDGKNIDNSPQYPAYYAGQFYQLERLDSSGNTILDSIPYDNIISIAALNSNNELSDFSNFGNQSVTLSAYGENLLGYGIGGVETIYSGTSMATFFTTRELATEMAKDKSRTYSEIWKDFEQNYLIVNEHTIGKTITGKQINVSLKNIQLKNNSLETNKIKAVFPNPSNGKINIELDCIDNFTNPNFNIKVFNIFGVEVSSYQKPCAEHIQLDMSSLNKGTYLIEISGFSKSLYAKMILK